MKLDRQLPNLTVMSGPFVPPIYSEDDAFRDEAYQELCDLWPDPVDLAKQPGLLLRLHAMLND